MVTLKFSQEQLQIINMSLGEIPHKFAGPLIQNINQQILAEQEKVSGKSSDDTKVDSPDSFNSHTD